MAKLEGGGQIETVGKHRHLVGATVAIAVLEDFDSVARFLAGLGAERIFVELDDPQASAFVPGHGNRVDDLRFRGEQANFEAGRHDELFLRLFRGQRRSGGWRELAGQLFSRRIVFVDREIVSPAAPLDGRDDTQAQETAQHDGGQARFHRATLLN